MLPFAQCALGVALLAQAGGRVVVALESSGRGQDTARGRREAVILKSSGGGRVRLQQLKSALISRRAQVLR